MAEHLAERRGHTAQPRERSPSAVPGSVACSHLHTCDCWAQRCPHTHRPGQSVRCGQLEGKQPTCRGGHGDSAEESAIGCVTWDGAGGLRAVLTCGPLGRPAGNLEAELGGDLDQGAGQGAAVCPPAPLCARLVHVSPSPWALSSTPAPWDRPARAWWASGWPSAAAACGRPRERPLPRRGARVSGSHRHAGAAPAQRGL